MTTYHGYGHEGILNCNGVIEFSSVLTKIGFNQDELVRYNLKILFVLFAFQSGQWNKSSGKTSGDSYKGSSMSSKMSRSGTSGGCPYVSGGLQDSGQEP